MLSLWTSILHCHSPGVATGARRLRYSVIRPKTSNSSIPFTLNEYNYTGRYFGQWTPK